MIENVLRSWMPLQAIIDDLAVLRQALEECPEEVTAIAIREGRADTLELAKSVLTVEQDNKRAALLFLEMDYPRGEEVQ